LKAFPAIAVNEAAQLSRPDNDIATSSAAMQEANSRQDRGFAVMMPLRAGLHGQGQTK
jgi:hypothetical protein